MSLAKPGEEEDRYFQEKEAHERQLLRLRLEQQAEQLQRQAAVAESLALDDQALAAHIVALGLDAETAVVLPFLPLIDVAWADGVTHAERAQVREALREAGLAPGGRAWQLCEALLEERPGDAFLAESRAVLRALLQRAGAGAALPGPATIIDLCVSVAEASGGLLGLGRRISDDERSRLATLAEALGPTAQHELARALLR